MQLQGKSERKTRTIGAQFSLRFASILTACVCAGAFHPHALFGKAPALRSEPRNVISALNPVFSNSRPLFGVLPLKTGSSSLLIPALSKQSFVGSSQRLSTDFGMKSLLLMPNIALKAGKQPKDKPVEEEDEEEKEVSDILQSHL